MFKTIDLSQIRLSLNDRRTKFTAVSEDRKQICWLSQLRVDFVFFVDETQGAENSFQVCRTGNKNQKRIDNFLDLFRQVAKDYLRF